MREPRYWLFLLSLTATVACGASTARTDSPAACASRGTGAPPAGCEIVVGDCCYREQAEACAAAGCTGGCLLLESYPAQVQCE